MNSTQMVDDYIDKTKNWNVILRTLRSVMLNCGYEEGIKWGAPMYMINGKNVVGMAAFKSHVSLWFQQGVFLKDANKVLVNANEGNTKGLRQWRFKSDEEIDVELLTKYVLEARHNAMVGKCIKPARKKLVLSHELALALEADKNFNLAFNALSKGKQVEYAEHIGSAKQDATRISRLRKCIPMILDGIGLNDKYRLS